MRCGRCSVCPGTGSVRSPNKWVTVDQVLPYKRSWRWRRRRQHGPVTLVRRAPPAGCVGVTFLSLMSVTQHTSSALQRPYLPFPYVPSSLSLPSSSNSPHLTPLNSPYSPHQPQLFLSPLPKAYHPQRTFPIVLPFPSRSPPFPLSPLFITPFSCSFVPAILSFRCCSHLGHTGNTQKGQKHKKTGITRI